MSKIVGIRIDTQSKTSKDKIYYYKTDEDLKVGQKISIKVGTGGTPEAKVVISDSKKKIDNIKELEKV